ncbi:RNA polymerase sigma factor [Porphyromonas sp.]
MRRYESMSDDQLVHLYATGTNEAFDTLLLRYDAYVHTTIRYWVNDEDLVEDIFQDTFIKVMLTIRQGRYTATGKFRSWLGRIVHNLVMDHFRRQRTRGQELSVEGASSEELLQTIQLPSPEAIVEERLIHSEYVGELGYGLSQLSAEQREVVRLRYWEEKSFKEIAEETGVSINTALGRMRYALQHLRRYVHQ